MTDSLRDTIAPKSDQINFDDLMDVTKTITVTKVSRGNGEQPVVINYEGDGGKPYKPGKSMRRVLIHAWGDDGRLWAGKSMTLYGDAAVRFGGVAVGGIRISHMTDINRTLEIALTTTRGKRSPYTVKPLKLDAPAPVEPSAPTPTEYPDDKFQAGLIKMVEAITGGKMTIDQVKTQCAKTAPLTEAQIKSLTDAVASKNNPTEPETEQF